MPAEDGDYEFGRALPLQGGTSTRRVLDGLMQAILNEKNSPEILAYRGDLVKVLKQQADRQEETVEDLEYDHAQELRRMVFSLELKRIRYLLRLYLRTRLRKLEATAAHLLNHDSLMDRLSPLEQQYVQDYFVLAGRHLKDACLGQLPPDYQSLVKTHEGLASGDDMVVQPSRDAHVFCSVLADVGSVPLEENEVLDMKAGDLFIIRYSVIEHLVQEGTAVLV